MHRRTVLRDAAAVAAPPQISIPFLEETPDNWNAQLQVTLMGAVNPTHAVLPHMIENGGGRIVNFSSEAHKGQDNKLAMYGAAKAGVATFTKTLAKEFGGDDVRINAISPSATNTAATEEWMDKHGEHIVDAHALNRLGEPEDHANAVVFLASDAAGWITGEILSVNGGYL
jgi:NAD(P)-dependent dehydrogenase (short-subunit alcohol dehydrogenase family)